MITYFVLDYNPRCQEVASVYLDNCLYSLYRNRNPNIDSEVFVIDQGNQSIEYKNRLSSQCKQYKFNFISFTENKGISGGINFAARMSNNPYLCLVTSDTMFPRNLDTVFISELKTYSDIYQITPAVDKGDVPYQVEGYTTDTNPIRCISQELTIQCWKREVFDLIGYWDERWIACYESLDYPLRLFLSGNSAAVTHKAVCHHEHNTTYHNGSLAEAYGGCFDHGPLRHMWDMKWPGLDWDMMYDLKQYTEDNRRKLAETYRHNIIRSW